MISLMTSSLVGFFSAGSLPGGTKLFFLGMYVPFSHLSLGSFSMYSRTLSVLLALCMFPWYRSMSKYLSSRVVQGLMHCRSAWQCHVPSVCVSLTTKMYAGSYSLVSLKRCSPMNSGSSGHLLYVRKVFAFRCLKQRTLCLPSEDDPTVDIAQRLADLRLSTLYH
nr:V3 protein - Panicum streak virus [Panicum streak virus]